MRGIDQLEQHGPPNMNTDPSLIIVTPSSNHESKIVRPGWMNNGSFVVFRKLEQNVKGFEALTSQWEKYGCRSKEHMGAKLVGRWQSGKRLTAASIPLLVETPVPLTVYISHDRCSHCQVSQRGHKRPRERQIDQQLRLY